MRITNLKLYRYDMKLDEPYKIAYETIDSASNIFIKVYTSDDITGFGCCAPDLVVTSETPESVINTLQNTVFPFLMNKDPLRIAKLILELKTALAGQPSVLAGIDMALYDILGKKCRLPLWKILGGFRDRIKTSITIGIIDTDSTLKKAKEFVAMGFSAIKLKGGINVYEDIEKIKKIREFIKKDIEIRFDANQGYSVEDAIRFVKNTRKEKVELIEQPIHKDHYEELRQVTNKTAIPVMADESLITLGDAFKLAKNALVDMINIKLVKVGGIHEALLINAVAYSAGLETMVGCMDESAYSVAAGLHFALARPNVLYADLDSHFSLLDDPSKGAVILKKGILYTTDKPGIGFDPNI